MTTIFQVGQIWHSIDPNDGREQYLITRFEEAAFRFDSVRVYGTIIGAGPFMDGEIFLTRTNRGHFASSSFLDGWCIVGTEKSIIKAIPDFPLDPTLHVLQAGYIQDRQRKKHKPLK